ncbi:MAG TPA: hypothetical protein VG273_22610 [Bryobacteraceae bacterium]|nr:hypothetical protein [Bryobacteraceae bacterium]
MKQIAYFTASAAMMAALLTPAFGAPKPGNQSSSISARASIAQMQEQFRNISERAFNLRELAMNDADPARQMAGLRALKDEVNSIGAEVQALDAQSDSLTAWQDKTLHEIRPLLSQVAEDVNKLIQVFNDNRSGLRSHPWLPETAKVSKHAEKLAALLSNKLKLAQDLEKDQQFERDLSEHSGS